VTPATSDTHTLKCNEPVKIRADCWIVAWQSWWSLCAAHELRHSLDLALLTNQNGRYFCKMHLVTVGPGADLASSYSMTRVNDPTRLEWPFLLITFPTISQLRWFCRLLRWSCIWMPSTVWNDDCRSCHSIFVNVYFEPCCHCGSVLFRNRIIGVRSGEVMRFFWIRIRIGYHFYWSRILIIQNSLNTF